MNAWLVDAGCGDVTFAADEMVDTIFEMSSGERYFEMFATLFPFRETFLEKRLLELVEADARSKLVSSNVAVLSPALQAGWLKRHGQAMH